MSGPGKGIEIKVSATGGDAAAAEIRKPTDVLKEQTETTKELTAAEKAYQERKAAFEAKVAAGPSDPDPVRGFGGMSEAIDAMLARDLATKKLAESSQDAALKIREVQAAAQSTSEILPELKEADLVAEALERLGTAGSKAAGKSGGTGLLEMAEAAGIVSPELGSLARGLLAIAGGPMTVFVAAAGAAAYGLYEWKKSLDEWEAAQQNYFKVADEALRATYAQAEAEREASEATEKRTASLRLQSEEIVNLTTNQSSYIGGLRDELEALKERNRMTNELADAARDVKLEDAAGDKLKQEQIRNESRKEAQLREMQQLVEERKKKEELMGLIDAEASRAEAEAANKRNAMQAERDSAKAVAVDKSTWAGQSGALAEASAALAGDTRADSDERRNAAKDARIQKANAEKLAKEAEEARQRAEDLDKSIKELDDAAAATSKQRDSERNGLFKDITGIDTKAGHLYQLNQRRDEVGDLRERNLAAEAKEKADKEKADAERKKENDAIRNAGLVRQAAGGIVKGAFDAADDASEAGAPQRGVEALRKAAEVMSRDPSQGNLDKLESMIERLVAWAEKNNQTGEDPAKWRDLKRRIDILDSRQKKMRN